MLRFLEVVLFVLVGGLLLVTTYAALVGLAGAVTNDRYQRCPRCHRYGLAAQGQLHQDGCPHPRIASGLLTHAVTNVVARAHQRGPRHPIWHH